MRNSQGSISHGTQILSLVLLFQLYSYISKRKENSKTIENLDSSAVFYSQQAIVGVYMIAGIYKMMKSGISWFINSPNIVLQILKCHESDYNGVLTKEYPTYYLQIVDLILTYPNAARIFFSAGVFLEIFAFLALTGRKSRVIFGILIVFFHQFNDYILALGFPINQVLAIIFFVNIPAIFLKKTSN